MSEQYASLWGGVKRRVQNATQFAIALLALAMIVLCIGAAFGILPWLELSARIEGAEIANAGMIAQIGFAVFCLALLFFLPSNSRIMQLTTE